MAEIARDKPITKAQIKSIHVALSRHGIDDDTYRAKLDGMFGATTCKQLSRRDASMLLKSLGVKLKTQPGHCPATPVRTNNNPPLTRGARGVAPAPQKLPAGIVALPSPAQRRFITDLVGEIAWRAKDGYQHWLKKNMGLNHVATSTQAGQIIEGLKALKLHQDV